MNVARIAYVVDGFPKVTETFIAGEVAELLRRGVDLRILSPRAAGPGPVHGLVHDAGLLARTVYDTQDFAQALRELRPQLIHAHFARSATRRARKLAGGLGVPYTFTAHGYDVWRRPPDDLAERAAAAAALITVSQANADHLTTELGVARERIHVIPCGIDVDRFTPGPAKTGTPLIVTVARLHPVKNIALLLDAVARLVGTGQRVRVAVIGDGAESDNLRRRSDDLGLSEVVRFVGAATQEEVLDWWREADIGALSSDSEGMPVALMEAAACGLPVVATGVGGVAEMVEDAVTGFVVPPGDAAAFAERLGRLIADPALRTRMGAAARQRAVDRFSVTNQVDALISVWDRVLADVGDRS